MGEPLKSANTESSAAPIDRFGSFEEFYPYYLSEHRTQMCKLMHFMGMCLAQATLVGIILTGRWHQAWLLPVFGYGFAWIGHYGFEKNRPASFGSLKFFGYSFRGDFHMWKDLLVGRLGFATNAELKNG